MQITSPVFQEGESIPRKYTCEGVETSFPLNFSGIPSEAKSLALIMDDSDVPKNLRADGMWVHWVVYGIDPKTTEVKEGTPSLGTQGVNTGGKNGYQGPCPPDREHRYFIKLYALDMTPDLKEGATKEELLKAMEGHIIAQAELMGRYALAN